MWNFTGAPLQQASLFSVIPEFTENSYIRDKIDPSIRAILVSCTNPTSGYVKWSSIAEINAITQLLLPNK